jgi:hypothetical protein
MQLDDGSANPPDDGIIANFPTSTSSDMSSTLLGFDIIGCVFPTVVSAELTDFEARIENSKSILDWKSLTEIDHDYFGVEWSENGDDFREVGIVEAKGNKSLNNYRFVHQNPVQGHNYYRLKLVAENGSFTYSDIRILTFDNLSNPNIRIFPNPAKNWIAIAFDPEIDDMGYSAQLLDITGNLKHHQSGSIKQNSIKIPIRGLASGQYILRLKTNGKSIYSRIVKL